MTFIPSFSTSTSTTYSYNLQQNTSTTTTYSRMDNSLNSLLNSSLNSLLNSSLQSRAPSPLYQYGSCLDLLMEPTLFCPSVPSPLTSSTPRPSPLKPIQIVSPPYTTILAVDDLLLTQPGSSSVSQPAQTSTVTPAPAPTTSRTPKPHPFSVTSLLSDVPVQTPGPSIPHPSPSPTEETLPFSVTTTRRGKPLITLDGCSFYLQKKNKVGTQLFVCSKKRGTKCPVSLTIDGDLKTIVRMAGCHNH